MSGVFEHFGQHALWVFLGTCARFGPILWLAPPFHSSALPARIRLLLTAAFSLVLTPFAMTEAANMPGSGFGIASALSLELLLGGLLSCIFGLTTLSLRLIGTTAANLTGLGGVAGSSLESEGDSAPSSLFLWLGLGILLVVGGHRLLIECCLQSLSSQPIGTIQFQDNWFIELEAMLRHSFSVAARAGLCIFAVVLMTQVAIGLIARAIPQINVFSVGFGANALSLLAVIFLMVGGIGKLYESEIATWMGSCSRIIEMDP